MGGFQSGRAGGGTERPSLVLGLTDVSTVFDLLLVGLNSKGGVKAFWVHFNMRLTCFLIVQKGPGDEKHPLRYLALLKVIFYFGPY